MGILEAVPSATWKWGECVYSMSTSLLGNVGTSEAAPDTTPKLQESAEGATCFCNFWLVLGVLGAMSNATPKLPKLVQFGQGFWLGSLVRHLVWGCLDCGPQTKSGLHGLCPSLLISVITCKVLECPLPGVQNKHRTVPEHCGCVSSPDFTHSVT